MKPKAYTNEEVARNFVAQIARSVHYWSTIKTDQNRLEGLAFSILVMIDGGNAAFPPFNIAPAPHPDDRQYAKLRGEQWYTREVFNADVSLHDMFHKIMKEVNDEQTGT